MDIKTMRDTTLGIISEILFTLLVMAGFFILGALAVFILRLTMR